MNNLQVVMPYQPCCYHCPMCCARGKKHEYKFDNLYRDDYKAWQSALIDAARYHKDIVITGECDPSQNANFVRNVVTTLYNWNGPLDMPNIEITTHNQKYAQIFRGLTHVDTVTLSVTNVKEYLSSWRAEKDPSLANHYRMVILLTKEFEFLTPDNFNAMGFDQVTFKTLQYSDDGEVNRWIYENKMSDAGVDRIREIVDKFNGDNCSVRLDTSCQDGTNRYDIFRSDGKIYDRWEASKSAKEDK